MLIRLKALTADAAITEPPYKAPITDEWVAEFAPISWSIKREQDNTGSWSFTVPATLRHAAELKRYSRAYFFLDGNELMHGLVDDVQLAMSGDKIVYSVSGLGEIAELDRELSANFTHYLSVEVVVILQELLRWTGWRLGDFTTMQTYGISTTIDLREQETVLQQVKRVCESVPGLHYRWGGYNCQGKPTLDIGFFDEVSNTYLTQTEPQAVELSNTDNNGFIMDAQVQQNYTNLISEVHGNGGSYNLSSNPDEQRVMTLWHVNELFTLFPALENPDYPIILDGNGFYRIRNIALYPDGSSIRKTWDFMATQNESPPTFGELVACANGLYQKCIRFLQEHAYSDNTYSLKVAGLYNLPYPGDRVNVSANFLTHAIPGGEGIQIEGESLQGDYRIGSWDMSGSNDKLSVSVHVTEHEYIGTVDADADVVMIAENREAHDIKNRASGIICGDYAITVVQDSFVDVVAAGNSPDCSICDTDDAITITVNFVPSLIGVFDWVRVIGILPDPLVPFEWDLVQKPTMLPGGLPGDPAIICFRFEDHPWDVTDSVTLTTYMRFGG